MTSQSSFQTQKTYHSREDKASYVFDKYKDILKDSVLDVGSDQCYLKQFLPQGTEYVGVGLGGTETLKINLEHEKLPFEDGHFHTVMCLDVLEHLENIHAVFDELCRVSKAYVIISLPNPSSDLFRHLRSKSYGQNERVKFYGLPFEKPEDRHKWFFTAQEARAFIAHRAANQNMTLNHMDQEGQNAPFLKRFLKKMCAWALFDGSVTHDDVFGGTQWFVLKKQ